ncbi:hypothetical protein ACFJ96_000309 [Salmonella enterica]|uniref:hypothetical protein n=1 Tax=Salmonella enterica TaxID=28901 RepID=UPI0012CCD385|nr:hypothetical protein [Salmonella enterica]EDJ1207225.1 hypothetical protein [Salmonella enterica]EDJ9244272.1 hypothetical protein [Salmonella enterica subsp. diarizonae]EDM1358336.1 hypothetical protein [Salmonella enterica subsp. enterica serovar Newport]
MGITPNKYCYVATTLLQVEPLLLAHNGLSSSLGSSLRVISDYVSGMTDEYATRLYENIFVPRKGSIFDRL